MTRRAPLHIRIGRIRVPHLPPGGEAALRREIHRELNQLLSPETPVHELTAQSCITIPCKSARDAANLRLMARQIAESIRQPGKRR